MPVSKGWSMNSRTPTISDRMQSGLLAAVFVVSNLFHIAPCCCASVACGGSLDAGFCCAAETTQECCCCDQASADDSASSTCCCSTTSQHSGASCPGTCDCSVSSPTEAIIVAPQRFEQELDQNSWVTDFNTPVRISANIASVELRTDLQFPEDPCAHNLRQAILCVWRN
jgi:hypothetical protein